MSYENCSIYLIANEVSENVQTVTVNCTCNKKLEALRQEATLTNKLLLENRKLMLKIMSAVMASERPASANAPSDVASITASVEGKIPLHSL